VPFRGLPGDYATLRAEKLAFFRYSPTAKGLSTQAAPRFTHDRATFASWLCSDRPIIYEDFLPVSAAGIFQSNLARGAAEFR